MRGPEQFSQGGAMNQDKTEPLSVGERYEKHLARLQAKAKAINEQLDQQMHSSVVSVPTEPVLKEVVTPSSLAKVSPAPSGFTHTNVGGGTSDRDDDELVKDGSGAWVKLFGQ